MQVVPSPKVTSTILASIRCMEWDKQTLQMTAKMVVQQDSMPGGMLPVALQHAGGDPHRIVVVHDAAMRQASCSRVVPKWVL